VAVVDGCEQQQRQLRAAAIRRDGDASMIPTDPFHDDE
jgi:hypothetical protein